MSSTSCKVYVLTNVISNKIYIGQTWEENVEDRMGGKGSGYHGSCYLFNAIQKNGVENFKYTVLEICFDQEMADYFEKYYIRTFNSQDGDIGYNIADGGGAPMQGKHHTEEVKAKISATTKGRKLPPAQVAKSAKSREIPQEKQKKIVEAYKNNEFVGKIFKTFGINKSGLYRVLRRANIPLRGQKVATNNFTGKQHSPATKAKMKQSAKKTWAKRKSTNLSKDELLIDHLKNIKRAIRHQNDFRILCDKKTKLDKDERAGFVICDLLCRDNIEDNKKYENDIEEYIMESSINLFDRCYEMIISKKFSIVMYVFNILDIPHSQLLQIFTTAIKLVQNKSFL